MAGAAGGALQTAQRIGSAIGTAVLAAVFYQVLNGTRGDYQAAASDALLCACAFMVLALQMAVAELALRRSRLRKQPALPELGEAHAHHI
jgi:hypothetical protein